MSGTEPTVSVNPGKMTISQRNYSSTHMLWGARDFSARAAVIEEAHTGPPTFEVAHRSCVVSAVINSVGFLEAMVNELFQDAHDRYGVRLDGYIAPLSPRTQELMREWWISSRQGRAPLLRKIDLLMVFAEQQKLDRSNSPSYGDVKALLELRNALVHSRSESVSSTDKTIHRLTKLLCGRFPDNALLTGPGDPPWWPDHALGAGCAEWAHRSARALADQISERLGIEPNYRRHRTWLDSQRPGKPDA